MRAARAARQGAGRSDGAAGAAEDGPSNILLTPGPIPRSQHIARYIAKQGGKRVLEHSRSFGPSASSSRRDGRNLASASDTKLPSSSDVGAVSQGGMDWGNWRLPRAICGEKGLQLLVGFEVDVGDAEYWNHSTTHHDGSKYTDKHKRIEDAISSTFNNGHHRIHFYDRPPPARCGAFEVMLTIKDPANELSHVALHSKLCSSKFPNVRNIVRRIHMLLGAPVGVGHDGDEGPPSPSPAAPPSPPPPAGTPAADKRQSGATAGGKSRLPCGKCGGTAYNKCTPIWNQNCRIPKRVARPKSAGAGASRRRRNQSSQSTIDHGQSARGQKRGAGGAGGGTFGPPDVPIPNDDAVSLYADTNPLAYSSLSSGLTRYDMRWIGDCCSDRCMNCGWTFLAAANHATACLPWRGPWRADYHQGNWGTTPFSCKHFPAAHYSQHVGSMRPAPGTQQTRRIFFDVVDSVRSMSAYPEAQCEVTIASLDEDGVTVRREEVAAHFDESSGHSSLQYVDVPVPSSVSVHVDKLRYTQVNHQEPFDVSYDSPALVTIAMKFDSTIHVAVRDTAGSSLEDADVFLTEVTSSTQSAGAPEDDNEAQKELAPVWAPAQPGEPPLSLKHPECKTVVEIPAYYAFKASLPHYAQQTMRDPLHLDYSNWQDIGSGVLEHEIRMVHLEIYLDIVDSEGNQCNGAVMELSCESSGERHKFVNKTGQRTRILRSIEEEVEPQSSSASYNPICAKLKRWTAQATFRGYNVSYVEVGDKRMPAIDFELTADDWPHGGGIDGRNGLLARGPLHIRLVAIKYAIKVYFRDIEDNGRCGNGDGLVHFLPVHRPVRPANAKVTLVSSQGKTIDLHVGPACVNMFTIEELRALAGEYTLSIRSPGWKTALVRIGDRDLPNDPDAMFSFDAATVFPPGVCTATINIFMRYTPVPRLLPSFSTVGTVRQAASGIDLCFIIDATGSMGRYLKALRSAVPRLVQSLYSRYMDATVRVAVVAYKDVEPDADDLEVRPVEKLDFTTDTKKAASFMGSISPEGGGDIPEDMLAGLDETLRLNWEAGSTRFAFVIADAPCHGQRFHPFPDAFPNQDPHGLTAESILSTLSDLNVRLCFPLINAATSQMIEEFRRTELLEAIHDVAFDDREDELAPTGLVEKLQAIVNDAVSEMLFTAIHVSWSFPDQKHVDISHFELVRRCCLDDLDKGYTLVVPGDAREHVVPVPGSMPFALRVRAVLNVNAAPDQKKSSTTNFSNALETIIDDVVELAAQTPSAEPDASDSQPGNKDVSIMLDISALCDEEAAEEVGCGNAQVVREAWLAGLASLNSFSWLSLAGEPLHASSLELPCELADDHGHPGADVILSQVLVNASEVIDPGSLSSDWDAGDHGVKLNLSSFWVPEEPGTKFEWLPTSSRPVGKWEGWGCANTSNWGAGRMTYDIALRLARQPEELHSRRVEQLPPLSEGVRASLQVRAQCAPNLLEDSSLEELRSCWKEGIAVLRSRSWLFLGPKAVELAFDGAEEDISETGAESTEVVDVTTCCNFDSRRAGYDTRLPLTFNSKGWRLGWRTVDTGAQPPIDVDPKYTNDIRFNARIELVTLPHPFLEVLASIVAPAVDMIDGQSTRTWIENMQTSMKGRFVVTVGNHVFNSEVVVEDMHEAVRVGESIGTAPNLDDGGLVGNTWSLSDPYDLNEVADSNPEVAHHESTVKEKLDPSKGNVLSWRVDKQAYFDDFMSPPPGGHKVTLNCQLPQLPSQALSLYWADPRVVTGDIDPLDTAEVIAVKVEFRLCLRAMLQLHVCIEHSPWNAGERNHDGEAEAAWASARQELEAMNSLGRVGTVVIPPLHSAVQVQHQSREADDSASNVWQIVYSQEIFIEIGTEVEAWLAEKTHNVALKLPALPSHSFRLESSSPSSIAQSGRFLTHLNIRIVMIDSRERPASVAKVAREPAVLEEPHHQAQRAPVHEVPAPINDTPAVAPAEAMPVFEPQPQQEPQQEPEAGPKLEPEVEVETEARPELPASFQLPDPVAEIGYDISGASATVGRGGQAEVQEEMDRPEAQNDQVEQRQNQNQGGDQKQENEEHKAGKHEENKKEEKERPQEPEGQEVQERQGVADDDGDGDWDNDDDDEDEDDDDEVGVSMAAFDASLRDLAKLQEEAAAESGALEQKQLDAVDESTDSELERETFMRFMKEKIDEKEVAKIDVNEEQLDFILEADAGERSVSVRKRRIKKVLQISDEAAATIQSMMKAALYGMDHKTFFKQYEKDQDGALGDEEFKNVVREELKITRDICPDKDLEGLIDFLDDENRGTLEISEIKAFIEGGLAAHTGS